MNPPEPLIPLFDAIPEPVGSFLKNGGWLIVLAVVGLLSLLMALSILRGAFSRRRKAARSDAALTEDLAQYPPPPGLWGEKRLAAYGLPVRIRLVVVAPLGTEGGVLNADQVENVLEQVMPGLGHFVRIDKPRLRVWPTQLSQQGFVAAFRRHALKPDPDNHVSRWVMIMGRSIYEKRPVVVGMAFLADQDNTLGRITIQHPHQWMEALRVRNERP